MIASAVISALGTAASGLMSYFNNKKSQAAADQEYARQEAYAEAKAAENPLARADNQAVIAEYDRKAKEQQEMSRNRNKIMGGTPEQDMATMKALAAGRSSLLAGIGSQAAAQKDKWDVRAEEARQAKAADTQARAAQRNESYAALASNAANALSGIYAGSGVSADTTTNVAQTETGTAVTTADPIDWQARANAVSALKIGG